RRERAVLASRGGRRDDRHPGELLPAVIASFPGGLVQVFRGCWCRPPARGVEWTGGWGQLDEGVDGARDRALDRALDRARSRARGGARGGGWRVDDPRGAS